MWFTGTKIFRPQWETMLCEAMSAFPQHVLVLPSNVFISVTSPHHLDDGVTVSRNYWSPAIIVVV